MATPAPVSLCNARRVSDALSALGLRAVAGVGGRIALMAPWGSVMHTMHDADESDAMVAVVAAADLQAWLEARVVLEQCEHCAGAWTWGADDGHPLRLTIRTCVECDGEGSYLVPAPELTDLDDAALDAGDRAHDAAQDAVDA